MTKRELAELVRKCRESQKRYFRSKSTGAMFEAKDLEAKVDAAVKDVLDRDSLFETPESEP